MYGLVLEGGGAKGAYQIGAVKALRELGIEIKGVAGTSIGAINGAMIVQGDLEKAYALWYDISPSKVFDVNEEYLEELKNFQLNPQNIQYFMKKIKDIMNNKGLDKTLMRQILEENIKEDKVRASLMDFGFVTVSLSDLKPLELFIEDIPSGKLIDYLMASANLPLFKLERIDGKYFIDGAFYDNLPVNLLIHKGYKEFIAIRTHGLGIIRKVKQEDVKITYISPSDDLGNILDFNQDSVRRNLKLGYFDALKVFNSLKGRDYYLMPKNDEKYFVNFLLHLGEEKILRIGKILGFSDMPYQRMLFDFILPKLAGLLAIQTKGYEDLIIALYEEIAKVLELERFKIYTFEEFVAEISKNIARNKPQKVPVIPDFLKQHDLLAKALKDEIIKDLSIEMFSNNLI